MSGIDLHRQIESGVPGKAIPNLLLMLDFTREDFSTLLGRARKTLNELEQRAHLSRSEGDEIVRTELGSIEHGLPA